MHNCHVDANCSNTRGSFYCTCHTGYSGDGVTCIGKFTRIDTITLPIDNMADSVFPLPLPLLPCLSFLLGRRLWSLDRLSFNVFQVLRFTLLSYKKKKKHRLVKGRGEEKKPLLSQKCIFSLQTYRSVLFKQITATMMQIAPTPKGHFTARVIRDIPEMVSPVMVW